MGEEMGWGDEDMIWLSAFLINSICACVFGNKRENTDLLPAIHVCICHSS